MPVRRSAVSEEAREDLALQYAWYARVAGAEIAERYLHAFRQTMELLVHQPAAGVLRRFRHPRFKGVRSLQLPGAFRVHLLFYRAEDDVVVALRVLHGMRDLPRRIAEPPGSED
jgi:plasmid stabilization system protein ParE